MLVEVLTLKKKRFSSWFYNFDVYYTALLSGFWKQHQSLCNSKSQNAAQNPNPTFLFFPPRKTIWLISGIILIWKSSSEFVTTVIYLFRPKLQTLKIHPFFKIPLLPMSLPELLPGKISQWDWHKWNNIIAIHTTLMDIQKHLCIET